MPPSLGEQLDEKGWEAGAVVAEAMLPQLVPHMTRPDQPPPNVVATDWLLVISHTCDVVARSQDEPLLEVLHCARIGKMRAQYQGRKSTRRLDFAPNKLTHPDVVLSAHAIDDRYVIPRQLFLNQQPDTVRRLKPSAINHVQQWYALRYTRAAWPDAFNNRIDKKSREKLLDAMALLSTDDVEVRVSIAEKDSELNDDQSYNVVVYFVIDQIVWDTNPTVREEAHAAFAAFVSAIGACKGVKVDQELSGLKSGDAFSWQLTKLTDEWNFANLSEND